MQPKPVICLTFDLEEFDLPLEYKQTIEPARQIEVTREGMRKVLSLLEEAGARCTFFTTANFALANRDLVRSLAGSHEIASHSYYHSSFDPADPERSKKALEEITGKPVAGFRMPRMLQVDLQALRAAGYRYDSSLHPTWIPGRYNHFSSPRIIHKSNGITLFPASVTPFFRSPLFWLSFKNAGAARYNSWLTKCLQHDGYANIYMHPWEFADLSGFRLPAYIKKDEKHMQKKLRSFLSHFTKNARFIPILELLQEKNEI